MSKYTVVEMNKLIQQILSKGWTEKHKLTRKLCEPVFMVPATKLPTVRERSAYYRKG